MSAYPLDKKAELFSALCQIQRLRHLPFAENIANSLEIAANTLGFDIAIVGKITGDEWQAIAINGISSLSLGDKFPLAELPCYATANSASACYQEKTSSPDAAFNYAVYLGRALQFGDELYGTLHLGRKSPLSRPLLPEEEEFFLLIADNINATLERQADKEREQYLRNQNQALNAAQTAIHMGYWYWDVKTNKTEWSEELFRVYGLEPFSVDTNYQEWLNVIAPEDRERCNNIVWGASQTGTSFEMDWDTIQRNSGERRHLISVGDCIKDSDGNVIAMFGTAQDITEKKRAQDRILKSEQALTAAQSVAKLGHWRWDLKSNLVEWSDEYFRLHGYEAGSVEPSYELWRKTIAPEDQERMETIVKAAIETKTDYEAEYDIVLPNGERRSQYSLTRLEFDEKGEITYLFGIGQDITERKKAEEALRRSELSLKTSQRIAKLGHWRWIIATNEVEWSEEQFRNHGFEPHSVTPAYELWLSTVASEDRERVVQLVQEAAQVQGTHEAEYDVVLPNGERRRLYVLTYPERDANNNVIALFGVELDITERKKAEEAMRRSELNLKTSQRIAKLGHWRWNILTDELEWSEETYRLYGYEPYSIYLKGQSWLDMVVLEDRERIANSIINSGTSGVYEGEFDTIWPNGERHSHYVFANIERDAHDNIIALFGIDQDVTERKKAEEAMRRSELNLKASQRIAKLGHWRWLVGTNNVEWSEETYRLYGYEPYSVQPSYERWLSTVAPEDYERMSLSMQETASGGAAYEGECDTIWPNGERHSHYVFANVERDAQGKIIALFGIDQDITERKKLENILRDRTRDLELAMEVSKQISQILTTEELLSHLVEMLQESFNFYHVSVFIYDKEENTLVLQDASGEVGKILKDEGKQFSLMSQEKGLVLEAARTHQGVLENDISTSDKHSANSHLPLTRSELALPMLVGNRLIGVLDLQSSQVNHFSENELRVLSSLAEQLAIAIENAHLYSQQATVTQKLIQLDKLKSQFLANMSHELRTPLNAILNFSSFVAKGVYGEVNAEQEENLNKVIGSATHLLALINDILDLSKIEAGMMNLFIEDANMNTLFQNVINTASGLARPQAVKFVTEIVPNLPVMKLDKRRIRQIFLNLLSNAFKFTQAGEVKLTVLYEDNMLICSVSDTGSGIPSSEMETVFEPFKQTDIGVSKGGTGLGLPISRYFAEAHGGKLWVESEFGHGATFYVSLPVQVDVVHKNF